MDIEKSLSVTAPIRRVWEVLLDPALMAGCVPGVQSVDVVSDVDYVAELNVKISFISARFKVRTHMIEARAPSYLRCEGSGDDTSVASSVKFGAELFLTERDSETDLTVKASADVFGRLGSFGLAVMKTKVDRMWEEFGANLSAVLRGAQAVGASPPSAAPSQGRASSECHSTSVGQDDRDGTPPPARLAHGIVRGLPDRLPAHWWQRLLPGGATASTPAPNRFPGDIYVEVKRGESLIKVVCPANASDGILSWLRELSR